jgi:uncharacterized protein
MSTREIVLKKSAEIKAVAARHGANNVRLFGSVARDEQGPESDIDFLVDAGPNTSAWFPAGLILDLEDMLGRKVEVVNREGAKS